MMCKVYSIDFQLHKVTGVEKVMLDIHRAIQGVYEARIVGNVPFCKVRPELKITPTDYVQLKSWFMFRNSIVIVHERRLLLLFWLLNSFLFQNIKVIYVHHNVFHTHKYTTLLPETIVAIADRGVENLTEFFHADICNIHKIYNCVVDEYKHPHQLMNRGMITLLLPGRINNQKQQLEIVRHLSGKIDPRIRVLFAGDGPQLDILKAVCEINDGFEALGFREDVKALMSASDFVLLFSVNEGLPITLIEATMMGMPIICNDVGGNAEICHNGINGWVLNTWDELINTINFLPYLTDEQYSNMCRMSREIYSECFTFNTFKKKYLNLLSSLS